jgi:translation initiation factor IF-1
MAGSGWTGPRLFALLALSPHGNPGCRLDKRIARSQDKQMEDHIEVEGRILTVLAGTMFRVELDNKHQVLATISGKMRKRFVRLIVGDRVKMEMSPYDLNKARIVWRLG